MTVNVAQTGRRWSALPAAAALVPLAGTVHETSSFLWVSSVALPCHTGGAVCAGGWCGAVGRATLPVDLRDHDAHRGSAGLCAGGVACASAAQRTTHA